MDLELRLFYPIVVGSRLVKSGKTSPQNIKVSTIDQKNNNLENISYNITVLDFVLHKVELTFN
ncbi:hypothetical protein YC2023_010991 [Brassica napus]